MSSDNIKPPVQEEAQPPLMSTPTGMFVPNQQQQQQQHSFTDNDTLSEYFSTDMDFDTAYMYLTGETDNNLINSSTNLTNITNNNLNSANSPTLSAILRQSPSLSNTQLASLPFYGGGSPRNFLQNHDQIRPTTPVTEEYIKTVMNLENSNVNSNSKSTIEQQRRELLSKPPSFSLSPKVSYSSLNTVPLDNPYLNGTAPVTSIIPLTPTNMFPDHMEQGRGSPISPNTKNVLTTFNTLNYNANTHSFFTNNYNNNNHSNNNNHNDLLSSSETDAIANFLDSIANNQSFENLSKHWHSIDPEATLGANNNEEDSTTDNYNKNNNKYNNNKYKNKNGEMKDKTEINHHLLTQEKMNKLSVKMAKNTNTNNDDISKKTIVLKPVRTKTKSNELSKKVLSEQEKKYNHTSSEQKRRALIKDSFDKLVGILSDSPVKMQLEQDDEQPKKKKKKSTRKSLSKYHIMMLASNEIERLIQVNNQLSDLVGNDTNP